MSRRKARLTAVQYLYAKDFGNSDKPDEFIEYVESPKKNDDKEFAEMLIKGTMNNIETIDKLIATYAKHGDDIITAVDKNILRVGIYELLNIKDTPYPVVINEYVEIAKELSKDNSKSFINAVLDKIKTEKL